MAELLTAAQMRAIEQAAIESGDVTGLELMERAGRGVVKAIYDEWPELAEGAGGAAPQTSGKAGGAAPQTSGKAGGPAPQTPRDISGKMKRRAVVLCGPGNNGGDGFVVARLLKERGWEVEVFLYGDAEKLPPDARVNHERWLGMGSCNDWDGAPGAIERSPDLVIDAVFGTGLTRPLGVDVQNILAALSGQVVVSVDLPSGTDADSGRLLISPGARPERLAPAMSVVFHREKIGCRLADGAGQSGKVIVADIGLGDSGHPPGDLVRLRNAPIGLGKRGRQHKFSHGHGLILSGGVGKGGAGRLAARGALRIGAGLVTVGPTPGALQESAARLDAVMLAPIKDADTLRVVLQDERVNALCLGPGLGIDRARELVPVALEARRATVLDADALTAFAERPQVFFDMLHGNCVLTPHAGEFARLFPDLAGRLNAEPTRGPAYSKVDATREAAARAGCVVLFKGADTVIAAPDGRCAINSAAYDRAAPWLATAGAGDVLAGFITGLQARGLGPMTAAETGAWLHVECALEFGPGLIAEDLPEQLPRVFRKLGL
ncbi:NAD(P)H-hydrate dehydratase [Aliiroseovarius sp.]|uniref:NAD(P)H-hydrate dehydratase n=1 Tax=Aliiroseovarius sp. TaxID=1872442 RepID=UPI00260446AB|nr:NAD(P)H-hydrate dehydratase [Aliiroseovarius sp.]